MKRTALTVILALLLTASLAIMGCEPEETGVEETGEVEETEEVEEFPNKPIEFVIPFGAGGGTDIEVRGMATEVMEHFGVPWRLRNVPGAAAMVGWEYMLNQPADGYTMLITSPAPVIGLLAEEDPPFSPYDSKIVCQTSMLQMQMGARPDDPFNTWDSLLEYLEDNPDEILTAGNTHAVNLGVEYFLKNAGLDDRIQVILYASGAEATADYLGGHLDILLGTVGHMHPLVPDEVVIIVNTSEYPVPHEEWEDVPSAADLGFSGIVMPRLIMVHPETPDWIVDILDEKMKSLLTDETVIIVQESLGTDIAYLPRNEAEKEYNDLVEVLKDLLE